MNGLVLPTASDLEADLTDVRSAKISAYHFPLVEGEGAPEYSELNGR
ncbi:hypothetical protein [Amycolatopsis speibonae]|uniref:Uncharacterized protein n=1 Tax=Amycolatopsis speibonae TaxID=1450224 RepID=A0ABV7NX00_9PSEU